MGEGGADGRGDAGWVIEERGMTGGRVMFHEEQRLARGWAGAIVGVVTAAGVGAVWVAASEYLKGARTWPPKEGEWGLLVGAAATVVIFGARCG